MRKWLHLMLVASLLLNAVVVGPAAWRRVRPVVVGPNPGWWKTDPYWQLRVSEFKNVDKLQPDATVFFGDSITDFFLVGEYFPGTKTINRGVSADDTSGALGRLQESVIALQPRRLVLLLGTNDISKGRSVDEIVQNYGALLDGVRAGSPQTDILVQSVFPTSGDRTRPNDKILALNERLKHLAADKGVAYVDVWSALRAADGTLDQRYSFDGLHLNGIGYQVWADQLQPLLSHR